jgi:hypothetical protein
MRTPCVESSSSPFSAVSPLLRSTLNYRAFLMTVLAPAINAAPSMEYPTIVCPFTAGPK